MWGASWTGELYPTIYNCDFKDLITSENNKLENPNNAPVQNTTKGTAEVGFKFKYMLWPFVDAKLYLTNICEIKGRRPCSQNLNGIDW